MLNGLAIVFDDIVAGNDPEGGDGYLGYINGDWPDYAATVERFPGKPVISTTVNGLTVLCLQARMADMEKGDYTAATAAQWASMKITGSYGRPTIYCDLSDYLDVAEELHTLGLAFGADVDWLEALWDGKPVLSTNPGTIGKQYLTTDSYDQSVVLPSWLGITPAPLAASILGGSTMGKSAFAVRPASQGGGIDMVAIAIDGKVHWEGDSPYWTPGSFVAISPQPPGTPIEVGVAWSTDADGDVMLVGVLQSDGTWQLNTMHPSKGWLFDDWSEMAIWISAVTPVPAI